MEDAWAKFFPGCQGRLCVHDGNPTNHICLVVMEGKMRKEYINIFISNCLYSAVFGVVAAAMCHPADCREPVQVTSLSRKDSRERAETFALASVITCICLEAIQKQRHPSRYRTEAKIESPWKIMPVDRRRSVDDRKLHG